MASSDTRRNTSEKTREVRLRRMADRQGLRLVKSKRRDPHAIDFGKYMLVEAGTPTVVAGADREGHQVNGTERLEFSLDNVEAYLTRAKA